MERFKETMSSYEDYEETSRNYDETRRPIGAGIILGCLAQGPSVSTR